MAEITKFIFPEKSQGTLVKIDSLPEGASADGIFYVDLGAQGIFKRMVDGSVRASYCGLFPDGHDYTQRLVAALQHNDIREIIFDAFNGKIVINGEVNVPTGKKLIFKNDCQIDGTGTIRNAYIEAPDYTTVFSPTLNVQNLLNPEGSVVWFGAKADNTTDNLPIFQKAVAAFRMKTKLRIPGNRLDGNDNDHDYYLSNQLVISNPIELYGDGISKSCLMFRAGVGGIRLQQGVQNSHFHDFWIRGHGGNVSVNSNSSTAHGWLIEGNGNTFERLYVTAFDGDGFSIQASIPEQPEQQYLLYQCC